MSPSPLLFLLYLLLFFLPPSPHGAYIGPKGGGGGREAGRGASAQARLTKRR